MKLAAINIGEQLWLKEGVGIGQSPTYKTPGGLISLLLKNVYMVAGIILFFLLLFGGLNFIIGAGSGDPKKTAQGQQAVTQALLGFLLIFTSYWIIQLISFVTGVNILNPSF